MCRLLPILLLGLVTASVQAVAGGLDAELQNLKIQALELERDVLILEEQLSRPVSIYLSMDADSRFKLDTLDILLDGRSIRSIEYDSKSIAGLRKGGAQLVYRGELAEGNHELIAYYRNHRAYQRGAKISFRKTLKPAVIEIMILRDKGIETLATPKLEFKIWDTAK